MALFECPRCGTKLTYASKEHPCKGGKSSDGGGESRPATVRKEGVSYPEAQANRLPSTKLIPIKGEEAPSGPRAGSRIETARVAPSPSEAKRGRGRPKIEEKRQWEIEGVTRATWYRRQKGQKK
jgi:hypothetical protein